MGLIAALLWGLHDLLIRLLTQRLGILISLTWVLFFGLAFLLIVSIINPLGLSTPSNLAKILLKLDWTICFSGIFFALACLALFQAFKIGPIVIVAPIIGIYPIISLILAHFSGNLIKPIIWPMVFFVVIGIGLIGVSTESQISDKKITYNQVNNFFSSRFIAISCSLIAAMCFSFTFHLGQTSAASNNLIDVTLASRLITLLIIFALCIFSMSFVLPSLKELIALSCMGLLDVCALLLVFGAGSLNSAALAPVASANFGIFTLIFAYLILGETLSIRQVLGILCVFSCLTLILLV